MTYPLLVVAGCGLLLAADAVPGLLGWGTCCLGSVPLVAIVSAVHISAWLEAGERPARPTPRTRRAWVTAGVVAVLSAVLSAAEVPRRVGLWWSRPAFEALLADAPTGYRGSPLGRRVGLFFVDRYAADADWGVFFRTAAGPDGIGPDTLSHGFAHRPHHASCPFGHARYRVTHLFGDWYAFDVSDDS